MSYIFVMCVWFFSVWTIKQMPYHISHISYQVLKKSPDYKREMIGVYWKRLQKRNFNRAVWFLILLWDASGKTRSNPRINAANIRVFSVAIHLGPRSVLMIPSCVFLNMHEDLIYWFLECNPATWRFNLGSALALWNPGMCCILKPFSLCISTSMDRFACILGDDAKWMLLAKGWRSKTSG